MKLKHLIVTGLVGVALVGCQQKKGGDAAPPEAAKAAAAEAGKDEAAEPAKDEAPAAAAAGTNTLKGSVAWDGDAPKRKKLNREADPVCDKEEMLAEETIVTEGKLANVVVTIAGQGFAAKAASGDIAIAQQSCMYRPRIQCGVVGQKVAITNADATMHNIHGYKEGGAKSWFNQAQMGGAPPVKKELKKAGVAAFKCDVHPWMAGYVYTTETGYCAVSAEDGSWALEGLPAGKWTITAWHEIYGEKTAEVTIEEGKEASLDITYSANDKQS